MIKTTTLSLLSGGLLAAGFAYAYARQVRGRRSADGSQRDTDHTEHSTLEAILRTETNLRMDSELESFDDMSPDSAAEEIDIELVDLDAVADEEEAYDAISPDDLGALWLSRATQTSGERRSPSIEGQAALGDESDVDPAGRPTDPPDEPIAPKHPRTTDG